MSLEQNKELARRGVEEIWNQGKLEVVDELVAPDYVRHDPNTPDDTGGAEVLKQRVVGIRQVFPDLHITIHDLIAEGDRVAIRATMRATQKGDLPGIPATGKTIEVETMDIVRIVDGKQVEHWRLGDRLGMLQQLGAMPTQGA